MLDFIRFDLIKEIIETKFPKYSSSEIQKIIEMIKAFSMKKKMIIIH